MFQNLVKQTFLGVYLLERHLVPMGSEDASRGVEAASFGVQHAAYTRHSRRRGGACGRARVCEAADAMPVEPWVTWRRVPAPQTPSRRVAPSPSAPRHAGGTPDTTGSDAPGGHTIPAGHRPAMPHGAPYSCVSPSGTAAMRDRLCRPGPGFPMPPSMPSASRYPCYTPRPLYA